MRKHNPDACGGNHMPATPGSAMKPIMVDLPPLLVAPKGARGRPRAPEGGLVGGPRRGPSSRVLVGGLRGSSGSSNAIKGPRRSSGVLGCSRGSLVPPFNTPCPRTSPPSGPPHLLPHLRPPPLLCGRCPFIPYIFLCLCVFALAEFTMFFSKI